MIFYVRASFYFHEKQGLGRALSHFTDAAVMTDPVARPVEAGKIPASMTRADRFQGKMLGHAGGTEIGDCHR